MAVLVIMAAAAMRAMRMMLVLFIMGLRVMMTVSTAMFMIMMGMVVMAVGMTVTVMMVIMIAGSDALLGPERTRHGGGRAALAARQLGQIGTVLDIDRIRRHLGQGMLAAEMPGETREAYRIFGAHFQKPLSSGLDLHEPAVFEPQGVAVVEDRLHFQIERHIQPALTLEMGMAPATSGMVQDHGIDNAVGLHGGLADDGGGAGHGRSRFRRMINEILHSAGRKARREPCSP